LCRYGGRSHIGDQRRFQTINRLTIGGLLSIGPENSNHDRLHSEYGTIRQSIDAPGFPGLYHLDFACVLRGTVYAVIHYALQLFNI